MELLNKSMTGKKERQVKVLRMWLTAMVNMRNIITLQN